MEESSHRRRRGGRRPGTGRGHGRSHAREERETQDRERAAREFAHEIEERLNLFIESDETEMALEPMNSFKRRIVHNLANAYNITSESRGEDRERHVYLIKTPESAIPAAGPPEIEIEERAEPERLGRGRADRREGRPSVRTWDYGAQVFNVRPGPEGIHIALKMDGSVELYREEEKEFMVTDRVVTTRQFRIRDGRIIQPGEPGW